MKFEKKATPLYTVTFSKIVVDVISRLLKANKKLNPKKYRTGENSSTKLFDEKNLKSSDLSLMKFS
jgi:hypothetical protein